MAMLCIIYKEMLNLPNQRRTRLFLKAAQVSFSPLFNMELLLLWNVLSRNTLESKQTKARFELDQKTQTGVL